MALDEEFFNRIDPNQKFATWESGRSTWKWAACAAFCAGPV